jgi:hypothetical protein
MFIYSYKDVLDLIVIGIFMLIFLFLGFGELVKKISGRKMK